MSRGRWVQQKMSCETEWSLAVTVSSHSAVALAVFCCIWLRGNGKRTRQWRALNVLCSLSFRYFWAVLLLNPQ